MRIGVLPSYTADVAVTDPDFDALRDRLVRAFTRGYEIPPEMRPAVRRAIREHQTRHYSDETIARLVDAPQTLLTSVRTLADEPHSLNNWGGFVDEWVTAWEYATSKNAGNVVLTIVNPDPTSKADLLHIVESPPSERTAKADRRQYKCVPGPDCKSGRADYVIEGFAKCARRGIPMVDVGGVLSDPTQLTPTQRRKFEALCAQFPGRRPIPSRFTRLQRTRVKADILNYLRTGKLPSQLPSTERPPMPTTGREFAPLAATLKQKAARLQLVAPIMDWRQFTETPPRPTPVVVTRHRQIQVISQPVPDAYEPRRVAPSVRLPPPNQPRPSFSWKSILLQAVKEATVQTAQAVITQRLIPGLSRRLVPGQSVNAGRMATPSAPTFPPPIVNPAVANQIARSAPLPHGVTGHAQIYHTRNGPEPRIKADYWRGKK